MSNAKSWKGLKGNVKFIVNYKSWATACVFAAGILTGILAVSLLGFVC